MIGSGRRLWIPCDKAIPFLPLPKSYPAPYHYRDQDRNTPEADAPQHFAFLESPAKTPDRLEPPDIIPQPKHRP